MTIRDMVTRHSNFDETKDFIPTPPYATRAFFKYVMPEDSGDPISQTAWDPAAGHGHMSRVLGEMGYGQVRATDINPHEGVEELDFTSDLAANLRADLIITNPPYALLNDFIRRGLDRTDRFLGLLTRVNALEGQARYRNFYSKIPPTSVWLFSDRVPFKTGVVVRKAPKMFFHTWLLWDKNNLGGTSMNWFHPEIQQELERDADYE